MKEKIYTNPYDAYLLMIGVAYIKMVETNSQIGKEEYQKVINTLMKEIKKI